MSWWKSLFASVGEQKNSEPQETQLQRFTAERATSLMEIINESLQLANNSTNPSTKVSRLELARAKLDSLELIAAQHPFIKLQRLDAVRKTIAQLAEESTKAGYYALTDESCREYRQDVWRGIQMPIADITTGWKFGATLQLRTPLRVLLRHGEVHMGLSDPPAIAKVQWEGFWLPILKTWREMGIDLDGSAELNGTMASDVGQVPRDGGEYLTLLVRLRKIVESDLAVEQRRMALRDELRKPEWADYCARLGGKEAVCCKFFPPFIGTITGLSDATVKAIWTLGSITPDALSLATDTELLAIKGIGPAKLKAIRAASANAQHPASEFVDNVAL
jgi:hypothetical protein